MHAFGEFYCPERDESIFSLGTDENFLTAPRICRSKVSRERHVFRHINLVGGNIFMFSAELFHILNMLLERPGVIPYQDYFHFYIHFTARLPFSIQRNTVTLLTPQYLATAPVVRNSGYGVVI